MSKTEPELKDAFAGESQATGVPGYAKKAEQEGNNRLQALPRGRGGGDHPCPQPSAELAW